VVTGAIPSATICVVKPLAALHRAGRIRADITLEYLASPRQVDRADVVVFCRNVEPAYGATLQAAVALGKPIIYDLDDNLLELPGDLALAPYYQAAYRQDQLAAYLIHASLVRVYSSCMLRVLASHTANVRQVDGPVDWRQVPDQPAPRAIDGKTRVVYATSRLGDQAAAIFAGDLRQLLHDRAGQVDLTCWGSRPPALADIPDVRYRPPITDYDRFFREFVRSGYDIGLAPLHSGRFYESKSNNKFREYAAAGIAGVYSNLSTYSDSVEHGVTGLLVGGEPGEWYRAVARLVDDVELRGRIRDAASAYARQHYGMERFCDEWMSEINAVLAADSRQGAAGAAPLAPARPRTPMAGLITRIRPWPAKFARILKSHGPREAIMRTRWALNDLRVLTWRFWA
jgi:glycosyltransferase involved in cell wall biosynthesis